MARNIIDTIQERLTENKTGTKTYASYEKAVATAEKLATEFETYHNTTTPIGYTVVMLPNTGRWTVVFQLSNWLSHTKQGIYVGYFAVRGFFCN